jgi:hypothetical protein
MNDKICGVMTHVRRGSGMEGLGIDWTNWTGWVD